MMTAPDPDLLARIRAQQVDYVARLLLARSEGAFDTDLAEELADLLARAPEVQLYPDEWAVHAV